MNIKNNTVLITGGATGIGFALAETLAKNDNTVIVCGRRQSKLEEAKRKLPQIHIRTCDISKEKERKALFDWVIDNFKDFNVLINNAGIQRMVDLKKEIQDLTSGENEIEINMAAPIYLSAYFIPLLMRQKEAAIINVSSGLAFVPIASMPVYCATKAGIHSFTMSLRYQLKGTSVKVFEIVPPMVDTDLGKGSVEEEEEGNRGISPAEVARAVMSSLAKDQYEIVIGEAEGLVTGSRTNPEEMFKNLNEW